MRVLIVEDEIKVRNFLKKGLSSSEISVDTAANLDEVFSNLLSVSYDVIVLDRLLGGVDSLRYISEIKKKSPQSKIIVLSALSEVDEKIEGLTHGADDYLGKPFHIAELIARIRAVCRRDSKRIEVDTVLILDDLKINLDSQRVERASQRIELTPKGYKLLVLLVKKPNKIFSKTDLLNHIWELQHYPESNVVEVAINQLRSKIDKDFSKKLIHSRRGIGYWAGDKDI